MTDAMWMETEGAADPNQAKKQEKSPAEEERDYILKYSSPFRTTSEMNVVWARGEEGKPLKAYDGFANFCLEITY